MRIMLNVGLIGNTDILEPYVKRLRENKNINVIGKASVGSSSELDSFHFTIPEFNRIELIERADVLVIDNSSTMPFKVLSEIIKKSKHAFTAGYIDLTIDECAQIVKLANESGSIIQVSNPYYFTPQIQWLNHNISTPVFLDILDFTKSKANENLLFPIVLSLIDITGISPKKVGAVTFNSDPNHSEFSNVRLEFGDASVVNISYGSLESLNEFKLRVFSKDKFLSFNFSRNTFISNDQPIDFSEYNKTNEFDYFINTIHGEVKKKSCFEDYLIAKQLVKKINKKITQFFAQ